MFDEISIMSIRSGRDEYRAIIIRNDFVVSMTNIEVKVVADPDAICTYKLAIAPLNGIDKYRRRFMEHVATVNNKPFHATFVDMTPDAVLTIGNRAPSSYSRHRRHASSPMNHTGIGLNIWSWSW